MLFGCSGSVFPQNVAASFESWWQKVQRDKIMTSKTVSQVAKTVVGLTEANAIKAIGAAGFIARVSSIDGVEQMGTCDALGNRINLTLVGGIVTETSIG